MQRECRCSVILGTLLVWLQISYTFELPGCYAGEMTWDRDDRGRCLNCYVGFFAQNLACTYCGIGSYGTLNGGEGRNIGCVRCPTRMVTVDIARRGIVSCQSCPFTHSYVQNKHASTRHEYECVQCNQYASQDLTIYQEIPPLTGFADNADSCLCNAGYRNTGPNQCESCAPGTFKYSISNADYCTSCQTNSDAVAGSAACQCNSGYVDDLNTPGTCKASLAQI